MSCTGALSAQSMNTLPAAGFGARLHSAIPSAIAEVAFLDIPGRVALKLLELADTKGQRSDEGIVISVPLSQRTLAGMVGASRENVNRTLHRFVQLGYIAQTRGTITVLKQEELRRRGHLGT